jgi:sugar lactone lactonase YvrE
MIISNYLKLYLNFILLNLFANLNFVGSTTQTFVKTYTISTVMGTGAPAAGANMLPGTSTSLSTPGGMWISSSSKLYVADTNNHIIRSLDLTDQNALAQVAAGSIGSSGTAGDTGPATSAQLTTPSGICGDSLGNLYIVDNGNALIRTVNPTGQISTIAGQTFNNVCADGYGAGSSGIGDSYACRVDGSGNVYFADSGCHAIRYLIVATSQLTTPLGNLAHSGLIDAIRTNAKFKNPAGLFLDSAGNFYIGDTGNYRVRYAEASLNTATITLSGNGQGSGNNQLATSAGLYNGLKGLWVDGEGNVFIADTVNRRIKEINVTNQYVTSPVGVGSGTSENTLSSLTKILLPVDVYGDSSSARGFVYYVDANDHRVRKMTPGAPISAMPSYSPSRLPSIAPTSPTVTPTTTPTANPTRTPSVSPSLPPVPTYSPSTVMPTMIPTVTPTVVPTETPTMSPSTTPTVSPSVTPTFLPSTAVPTCFPTFAPSLQSSFLPTAIPTVNPTDSPSFTPSVTPTRNPSGNPTFSPSFGPSNLPTCSPSITPTVQPTMTPSTLPTVPPSYSPTTNPTVLLMVSPSCSPTMTPSSINPTVPASMNPSQTPSKPPTTDPSASPSIIPTQTPSGSPTVVPTVVPSFTSNPTRNPTPDPSLTPTRSPTINR